MFARRMRKFGRDYSDPDGNGDDRQSSKAGREDGPLRNRPLLHERVLTRGVSAG